MNLTLLSFSLVNNKKSLFITTSCFNSNNYLNIKNCNFLRSFSTLILNFGDTKTIKIDKTSFKYALSRPIHVSNSVSKLNIQTNRIYKEKATKLTIKDSLFFQCEQITEKYGGGAIFIHNPNGFVQVKRTTFASCKAKGYTSNGGAILVLGGKIDIRISGCCFRDCAASFSGQTVYIEAKKSFSVLNQSSLTKCPSLNAELQTDNTLFICDHMSECVNQSNTACDMAPTFFVRGTKIIMFHYITLKNNTCVVGGSIYDIGYLIEPEHTSAGSWNIIGCHGPYQSIGSYRVTTNMVHSLMSVYNVNENSYSCYSGFVLLKNCMFEKIAVVVSKSGTLSQEKCEVMHAKNEIRMSKECTVKCLYEEDNESESNSSINVLVISLLFIFGLISAALFKLCMKANKKRNEKLYQQLAIPEIEL